MQHLITAKAIHTLCYVLINMHILDGDNVQIIMACMNCAICAFVNQSSSDKVMFYNRRIIRSDTPYLYLRQLVSDLIKIT